jgi:homoserine/homoserine lactone efflux protein
MYLTVWLSFVGASLVFGLIPGPSVCFTIAHALKHGARRTWPTILGQLMANCCQIIVVLFGMTRILGQSVLFFQGLKMCGAVYLIYLGYRQWTAGKPHLNIQQEVNLKTVRRALLDGFMVCGTNPKAILYYAALLPQFILPTWDEKTQLIILAVTSVIIAALVLAFYTILANRARYWLDSKKNWKTQNRLTGILMIGAGVTLAMVSRK